MKIKLLLLLGPTGVGKTALIHQLRKIDRRFVYITPYVTRKLRPGEKDKIHVSDSEMNRMNHQGKLLFVNNVYGNRHGTPKALMEKTFESGKFPVLDWPIKKIRAIKNLFPNRVYCVYLEPPDLDVLKERLSHKNNLEKRLRSAENELKELHLGKYDREIDLLIISKEGELHRLAKLVLKKYLTAIS